MKIHVFALVAAAVIVPAPALADDKPASRTALEDCARKFSAGDIDGSIAACKQAVELWPKNHRAWYVLGLAQASRDFATSADSLGRAVELSPDDPMYLAWSGIIRYEASYAKARADLAAKLGVAADAVDPALIEPDTKQPRAELERAVGKNPDLWRAQFYLGRILRAEGEGKAAATAFTAAIRAHADFQPAYLALADIYRQWGYLREAIEVATAGTKHVTKPAERARVWLQLGLAHQDAGNDDAAILAFGKALEDAPADTDALLQRGAAHYRAGDMAKAKADLQAGLAGAPLPAQRAMAERILRQIADR